MPSKPNLVHALVQASETQPPLREANHTRLNHINACNFTALPASVKVYLDYAFIIEKEIH